LETDCGAPPSPHRTETVDPLQDLKISDDPSHYTRDPDKPLQFKRLLLIIKGKRPAIVY
jgi:hypothetical protein